MNTTAGGGEKGLVVTRAGRCCGAPPCSIPGSAVCAFSMGDIEKVFQGRFKEQKTADSVWTPFPEEKLPKPR